MTGEQEFAEIIGRGHKLPAQSKGSFFPVDPTTESVIVKVVEGDPDSTTPDFTVLKEWEVRLNPTYDEGSSRSFELQYDYDVDGILHVRATDDETGSLLLEDDVSYGVATDKRQLKTISDRAKTAVNDGVINKNASVQLDDPEATKLIEQAKVKVIPFLDESEAAPIQQAVDALETADSASVSAKKAALKSLLLPHSYLF
jgi:molecular chaperone DnaK (HSP70)